MKKSIIITASAILTAVSASTAVAAPGDREYYPGASRSDMNMERGADVYGAPSSSTYDGSIDGMSTGSIYPDGGMQRSYGDGGGNKTYEPGAGDYYQGATPPR